MHSLRVEMSLVKAISETRLRIDVSSIISVTPQERFATGLP